MKTASDMRTLGALIESRVIEVTNGFPFGGHNESGSGVPHIRPFNVTTSGEVSLEQIKSIPAEAAAGKPRLQRGDIVFNNTNTKELVGKCAIWDHDAQPVFSNHMTRIRVHNGEWNAAYLSFAILHHWMAGKSEMLARAHVAQASIMGERFREIEIPWQCPADQRAVAAVLTSVREGCRSDVQQEQHVLKLKAAAMRELFTRGLRREPQKETEIGPIPASWDVRRLGDDFGITGGGTPLRSVAAYWEGGTIPWVKTAEVNYSVIQATSEHITQEGLDNSSARLLPPGTLLIAMFGQGVTRGRVAILGIEATCNQACAALRPRTDRVNTRFLYHMMTSKYEDLRQLAHGGQQQNLNIDIVRNFPVVVPSTTGEQEEIVAILDAIDCKIDLHRRKKGLLEELFKSLLHKSMTGEVRVADLDLSAPPAPEEARA